MNTFDDSENTISFKTTPKEILPGRSLIKLLQIMLDNIEMLEFGLCNYVQKLWCKNLITTMECTRLEDYIFCNKPSIFSSFDAFYCKVIVNSNYYWSIGKIEPRIKWLNKHIKKQKRIEKNKTNITSFTITYK